MACENAAKLQVKSCGLLGSTANNRVESDFLAAFSSFHPRNLQVKEIFSGVISKGCSQILFTVCDFFKFSPKLTFKGV